MTDHMHNDPLMALDDIGNLPQSFMPMICLCNGFTSVFGLLISLVTKGFWNHSQWLISPTEFASQWFWFTRFPVSHYRKHSLKLWYNPDWTEVQKAVIMSFITERLRQPKWATRYDVIGVIGEALGLNWLNRRRYDFCSEAIANILAIVDPDCRAWLQSDPSPTPEQLNEWLKGNKNYQVYARVMPG